jgi:hypothetical protein
MRRRNHSPAVAPVAYRPSGAPAAASAISVLSFVRGSRTAECPGRVKNTSDQRSYEACALGGGLRTRRDQLVESDDQYRDSHDSMQIRAQDTSTEDRHRVAEIANGMPGHWLKR